MTGIVKIHFASKKQALMFTNEISAGARYPSGRLKTWIGRVPRLHPNESWEEARSRVNAAIQAAKSAA